MSDEICDTCGDLRLSVEIQTPGDLSKALRVIRANLADSSITDVTQSNNSQSGEFLNLEERGPWPDHLSYQFKCTRCGHQFRLAVETYHGAGGTWNGD
jgi:hypothetical protein